MRSRLLIGLLAVVAMAPAQSELDTRLRMAVSKLEQGDAIRALIDLEAILARDDRYWPAYYHLGRTQVQLGDDFGAKDSFLRAAELNPGLAELHYLIATVGWQLAVFDIAWAHGIAAIQAGYDQRLIEQMFKQLRHYSDEPADLSRRLAAPRVVVIEPARSADEDGRGGALTAVARELRSAIFRSPELASVLEASLAGYRIELEQRDPEPARQTPVTAPTAPVAATTSSFAAVLVAVADGARLAEFVVHLDTAPHAPESMFEISHLVAKFEAAIDR